MQMECPRDWSRKTKNYSSALRRRRLRLELLPTKLQVRVPLLERREGLPLHNLHLLPQKQIQRLQLQMQTLVLVGER